MPAGAPGVRLPVAGLVVEPALRGVDGLVVDRQRHRSGLSPWQGADLNPQLAAPGQHQTDAGRPGAVGGNPDVGLRPFLIEAEAEVLR